MLDLKQISSATLLLLVFSMAMGQEIVIKDQYEFTFKQKLPCTEIKNQANTGTCWSFSTGSYLESEAIRNGKEEIDLSEMFWVRKGYLEKAEKYLRYHGKSNFSQGGLCHDILRLYEVYGAIPEEVYSGLTEGKTHHNHDKLEPALLSYLDSLIKNRQIDANWKLSFESILDQHLGPLPARFEYNGKMHDPKSFAEEFVGINPNNYLTITSFTHHKPYSKFILEVPDNFSDGVYLNVSLEDLKIIVNNALKMGQTIVWDCDVSEKGFSARQGLAIVPKEDQAESKVDPFRFPHEESVIDARLRQAEFDSYSLTDDHLMHIVGVAIDQTGMPFYYVKNSWGSTAGLEGYLFASEAYLLLNTIGMTVHKDAIPKRLGTRSPALPVNPMIETAEGLI